MDSQENGDCFIEPILDETQDILLESQFQSTVEEDSPSQIELNNKKKRGGNFTPEEDVILISSWLNTSIDPITGNDQKATTFWCIVSELYTENTRSKYPERTITSLISRWQTIQKAVNKFQGFFAQIEGRKQSGTTEQNKIAEAKTMYRSIQKSNFLFEQCWLILRNEQKWMAHSSFNSSKRKFSSPCPLITSNAINSNEGTTSPDLSANLERPMGKKAAKEKLKREKKRTKDDGLDDIMSFANWKMDRKKMHEEKINIQERKIMIQEEKLKIISIDLEKNTMIEERKIQLEQKKIERQEVQDEMNIMLMDTSSLDNVQKIYIESLRAQIFAKKM